MKSDPPANSRAAKADATRAAILASARKAFAEHGYDGAGLRGIAEAAGVTAMMVGRYFGSKEGLFGEVVADTMRDPTILSRDNLDRARPAARLCGVARGRHDPGADASRRVSHIVPFGWQRDRRPHRA